MEEMNICTVVVGTCTYKQVVEEKGICMASWVVVVVESGSCKASPVVEEMNTRTCQLRFEMASLERVMPIQE